MCWITPRSTVAARQSLSWTSGGAQRGHLELGVAAQREQLERIKRQAIANQLLLIHARACVKSMLDLATGNHFDGYSGKNGQGLNRSGATTSSPVRLSFRS